MKHRNRDLSALNGEEPDRCPIQIIPTRESAERLRFDLEVNDSGLHDPHGGGKA